MNGILVDAKLRRVNNIQKRNIEDVVSAYLRVLNSKIDDAYNMGAWTVCAEAPSGYTIPNLSYEDARTYILSSIIEQLQKANYTVTLRNYKSKILFDIHWYTQEELTDIRRRKQLLTSLYKEQSE
jgi:hypothetical protein